MKRLNSKMYAEAKRLGVKWILGGECGHMWRVINQYMDTMNGPADFLEVPVNPITGTKFENAKSTKMVHIAEFTADLIKHGKLDLDPSRNDNKKVTFHDSCNPARGMGMLDEPRYVIKTWCNNFMRCRPTPSGSRPSAAAAVPGLNAGEDMELRWPAACRGPMRSNMSTKIRGQHAGLCLRHRPRGLARPDGILGAGGGCDRASRTGGQCPDPAG
jgi:hypothetical protein